MSDNETPDVNVHVHVGKTPAQAPQPVTLNPAGFYPNMQELVRSLGQTNFIDSWRKFWQVPLEFDPLCYKNNYSDSGGILLELPPLADQRYVVEQVIISVLAAGSFYTTITDGADLIFDTNFVFSDALGGWDYLTFSPPRMQRVANQSLKFEVLTNGVPCSLMVNMTRF